MASFRSIDLFFLGVLLVACAIAMDNKDDRSSNPRCKNCTVAGFEAENTGDDGTMPQLLDSFVKMADDAERDNNNRQRRSAYDHGNYGYGGGYGGYGGDYAGGNAGGVGGYDGYGYAGSYGGGRSYGGGYGNGYNGNNGHVGYDHSYTTSPVLTFVKGFKPGKTYVEKGKVVRNYYRHGTYEVALQHYKFVPVVKVVPFTTYDTVGYTGHIQAHNHYTAVICKDCYHGYAKIDVTAHRAPYSYVTRRFVYLPENYRIDGYNNYGSGGSGGYNTYGNGH